MRQMVNSRQNSIGRQLLVVLLSALVPYIIWIVFANEYENLVPLHITLFASAAASLLSVAIVRGLGRYPGTESVSSIIPAISIAYGLLIAVLLFGRIDYARGMLFGSYISCGLFFFAQYLIWPTRTRLRVAAIQGGAAQPLPMDEVEWIYIDDPDASFSGADAVTVDLRADLPDLWERRLAELALGGFPVYHIKHLRESLTGRVELEHISETSYGTLSPPLVYLGVKRFADMVIAFVALLILWPLMTLISFAIRVDSPGPAIFKQRRIGFRGRVFVVRKFRTMRVATKREETREAAMTREGDARITRIGSVLRKTRLDELPQLLNVLCGEMSLIGPRPEAEILSKWYEQEIPFYRYRHIVLPGVTGWAQINQGHVTDVGDVASKLQYDFYYIKNLSPWIDTLIFIRTILIMVSGHGAK